MFMDRTTEAIAHFIGLFAITVEEARSREAFDKFLLRDDAAPDDPGLPSVELLFAAPYTLQGFDPNLQYQAPPPNWYLYDPWMTVSFKSPEVPVSDFQLFAFPGFVTPTLAIPGSSVAKLPEIDIVGSVANFMHQGIYLADNDYFGVGGHGLLFSPEPASREQLDALASAAAALSPLPDVGIPGSAQALADFTSQTIQALEAFQPASSPGTTVLVEKATTLEGSWVNGVKVDETPELEDHFSFSELLEQRPYNDDPLPANAKLVDGRFEIEASVHLQMGGNVLVNNATVNNFWTASKVTAVMGDHTELNVVVQINAWCDTDAVTSAIDNWAKDPIGTETFNIASFERNDTSASAESSGSPNFPKYWVVEEISGDLMIVNWMQQLTFMSDNDIGIASSSGVSTSVYAGGNIAYNTISIYELAFSYDLIVVGGSVFDLNIIHQLNLLYDNDMIGAVEGFQSSGPGSASTSNNLLWNDAYIYNIGGANRFDSLPDHYRESAGKSSDSDDFLSGGVLSDMAFAGFGFLKVLYITGDMFNINYIKQTNILSDSDQLALAMHESDPFMDADWNVVTGSNSLINNASIVDLDSLGKTYVGGSQYSQDVLVQADIISTDPEFGFQNPDVLVNEAVAFLDDETLDDNNNDYGQPGALDPDNAQGDALQTLIG